MGHLVALTNISISPQIAPEVSEQPLTRNLVALPIPTMSLIFTRTLQLQINNATAGQSFLQDTRSYHMVLNNTWDLRHTPWVNVALIDTGESKGQLWLIRIYKSTIANLNVVLWHSLETPRSIVYNFKFHPKAERYISHSVRFGKCNFPHEFCQIIKDSSIVKIIIRAESCKFVQFNPRDTFVYMLHLAHH